ncbi:MAG: hypothetical protein JO189_33315 [Deltaproteobacteria bacterium]|nr:hypothetical protein [Deltaproteobacteria bacterium]
MKGRRDRPQHEVDTRRARDSSRRLIAETEKVLDHSRQLIKETERLINESRRRSDSIALGVDCWSNEYFIMATRDREHYDIASRFGCRPFTRSEFNHLYQEKYPNRTSVPIPTDYCVNLNSRTGERVPKFLRWLGRGRYQFIGSSSKQG